MNKEKIFFLINSLEAWWAERVVSIISSELSKDYQVDLITLKNVNFYDLPNWVNYISLSNVKNNLLMFLLIPYYVLKFKKHLNKNNYKSWISSLEIANFVNILSNKNAIIAFEISIYFFSWFIWQIYKLLIKFLYPKAKKIKVNSEENKYDLANYLNIPLNKIITIYNPIELEKINKLKNEEVDSELKNMLAWKKIFITVWRLVWQKNHSIILKSFSKLKDKDWIYLIIWDWPEKQKLQDLTKNLWLKENIIFLWSQKNVFKYLNISNYFIYASKIEWFPNVLWESIACNIPIITSNFVSWAKECIIWNYDNNLKNIKYPYYWENWVLLDLHNYEESFIYIYDNLNKIQQNKVWFEKFKIEKIEEDFEKILFNN